MSSTFAILFYLAGLILVCGIVWKVFSYTRIPVRYLLPIAPAPQSYGGVALRILREVLFFESLFRANKWTWLFGWIFHYALLVVLLRHLFFVTWSLEPWVVILFFPGDIAAWLMIGSLLGLLGRRVFVDRVRYISTLSDYAMLILILLIGLTGMALRYKVPVDIMATREFMLGLMMLDLADLPRNGVLYLHLASVAVLVIVFPFSKLIHFPGYFFSPSHNQKYPSAKMKDLSK